MDSIANRYAIALLSLAREEKSVKEYLTIAEGIVEVFEQNEDLMMLLKAFSLSKDEKKEIVEKIFLPISNRYCVNLMNVVIDNGREGYIKKIFDEFTKLCLDDLNIKRGVVYTTSMLSITNLQLLEKKVSAILNANVTLTNKIDKSLLGGFLIKVNDYLSMTRSKIVFTT